MNSNSGEGYLKIRVTEAGGALPLKDALVIISEYTRDENDVDAGEVLYSLRTDEGGLTPTVALPAPPSSESMSPGAYQPYSIYNVYVMLDGYVPVEGVGVPVFSGVTAIQPINMVPISEKGSIAGGAEGRIMIYETPDTQSLQPGGLQRDDIGNRNGTITGGRIQPREDER